MEKLPNACLKQLDALTGPQEDSYILEPDQIRLNQLKAEAGKVSLPSLEQELVKLEMVQQVGVPEKLFSHLCDSIVERYRLRVETETLTELRRHPEPIRYTLLAAFCWQRSPELVDNVVELFILLVQRMERRSKRKVSQAVVHQAQRHPNYDKLLYRIALAALSEPEGLVKEVIYPIANEAHLEKVVDALDQGGETFQVQLMTKLRSAYQHYYARMLPLILKTLEFRSESEAMKRLLEAVELLKAYVDRPRREPYSSTEVTVPIEGVLKPGWQESIVKTDPDGTVQVDRTGYELAVD